MDDIACNTYNLRGGVMSIPFSDVVYRAAISMLGLGMSGSSILPPPYLLVKSEPSIYMLDS
eukprot:3756188-Karenia_brevis.AAC.1